MATQIADSSMMLSVNGQAAALDEVAAFLRSRREQILQDWRDAARQQSSGMGDAAPEQVNALLGILADDIGPLAAAAGSDATRQAAEAFALSQFLESGASRGTLGQLSLLRIVTVMRWWADRSTAAAGQELLVLERAFDELAFEILEADRQLQRERLERQKHLLDAVMQASPVGISILDGRHLTYKVANPAYIKMLVAAGAPGDFIGRRPDEVSPVARQDPEWFNHFRRVAETREPYLIPEITVTLPNHGEAVWSVAVVPLIEGAQAPSDLLVVVSDLTEQAREHRRVEEERRRVETILQTLPVGVIIADARGRITDANENIRRLWGGDIPMVDDIAGYDRYKGWWVRDGTPVQPNQWALARALRQGETSIGEVIDILRFDGGCGTMMNSAAPLRDADGKVTGAVAVMLDISEQRRLSVELERQTAEMNAVLDSIADALVVFGPHGEIVRMNAGAEALLPYTREELQREMSSGRPLERITLPDGSVIPTADTPVARALRGEVVRGELMRFVRPGSPLAWTSTSAAPIQVRSGPPLGAVAMFVDVTHIQEMRRQMEDLMRMLSHDLRTPLSSIVIQSHLLQKDPNDAEAVDRRAGAISTSARRMNAMIQDLVELSRLETGRLKLTLRRIDVRSFTLELQERLAGSLPTQRLRVMVPESLPAVLADPDRLERIVTNLLSNAFKYSPEGCEVLIKAERREGRVAISVVDYGAGIPAEDLPHIFDRYYRAHRAERGGVEGLGLGLYITRLLVEAHGGTITVEGAPGRGSTFTVVFPAV